MKGRAQNGARALWALALTLALALGGAVIAGCPPAGTLPSGCGKDTDCKGTRICVAHACAEGRPPRARPSSDAGALSDGGGATRLARPARLAQLDGAVDGITTETPTNAAPSPQFHIDAMHSGRSRFRAPATTPHEVARITVGGVVYSSPAVGDGVVVFGSHDRSVYAAANGAGWSLRWRHPTGDLVWGSPALSGETVYIGSDDDHLYALDLSDGKMRWQFQTGPCRTTVGLGPEAARCDVDGVTVAPDRTLYISADGLYALNPNGTLKWKFTPGVVHCASHPAVGPDGTIYVGCQDDALYAVGPDGQKRWEFRSGDDIDSSPAVAPDGTVYVGSDDHKLYAFDASGALKFAVATGGAVRSSPALASDGTVYFGSFDGTLYAVRKDGAVAWTYRTADRILSSPLVDAAGLILIGSEDDRLYALNPDGKLAWSLLLDGDVDSTPALGPDGTLYVGSDDRALHILR